MLWLGYIVVGVALAGIAWEDLRSRSVHVYWFLLLMPGLLFLQLYTDWSCYLCHRAGIKKTVGVHTLRHSIATHLLQSGMQLEHIQRFLGHSSLESTQIYTHIVNEKC